MKETLLIIAGIALIASWALSFWYDGRWELGAWKIITAICIFLVTAILSTLVK